MKGGTLYLCSDGLTEAACAEAASASAARA